MIRVGRSEDIYRLGRLRDESIIFKNNGFCPKFVIKILWETSFERYAYEENDNVIFLFGITTNEGYFLPWLSGTKEMDNIPKKFMLRNGKKFKQNWEKRYGKLVDPTHDFPTWSKHMGMIGE